ncbi:MAG: carboxylesterase [Cereibacter sphaeroides]|uniref:Carboxylesterase n=1 Tax=Cereibacter sphaeroides TaxID=1063 RepID=A0A2W5SD58_CERSP|nr:MAG: carboxylesterase [Cereibacter sphaeroides]
MTMIRLSAVLLALAGQAAAQGTVPVTVDNFIRAESDLYIGNMVRDAGGLGKLLHHREPADVDKQAVIRLNRDTLYSAVVFDLDAGPATITLPDAGDRFMSLQIIDEDHYVHGVFYGAGSYTLTREDIGTRYVLAGVRTLADPNDPADLAKVHDLQDAMTVSQAAPGSFELPKWDQQSQTRVRDALLVLGSTTGFDGAFGSKSEVDPIHHLIGTAMGWGGNPEKDATYLSVTPPNNDGKGVYRLTVPADVPVKAFWSISLYNAEGYYVKNPYNAYSLNNITAQKQPDGSVQVQFGGCDGKIANCLPIMDGWNYTVRLYRPEPQVLEGSWQFPQPVAVE